MTDYGYSNGRIQPGPRFRSWSLPTESYSTSDPWANSAYFTRREPRRDHVCRPLVVGADGRTTAVQPDPYSVQANAYRVQTEAYGVQPDPYRVQTNAYQIQTEAYLVQPDPYLVQTDAYMVQPANGNGRRTGFPGGLFQRPKPEGYTDGRRAAEPAFVTAGGWDRPSPAGWKLPQEGKLGGAAELVREAAARSPGNGGAKWEAKATEMAMEAVAGKNHAAGGGKGGAKWEATAAEMAMEAAKEIAGRKAAGKIDSREAIRKYGGQYM